MYSGDDELVGVACRATPLLLRAVRGGIGVGGADGFEEHVQLVVAVGGAEALAASVWAPA